MAVVSRADVTPVLTIDATVSSDVQFQLTANVEGTFQVRDGGVMAIVAPSGSTQPVAVVPGAKVVRTLVGDGSTVTRGLPVAEGSYSGFAMRGEIKGPNLLRFLQAPVAAKAQINGGGAPFECELLDRIPGPPGGSASGASGTDSDGRVLYCALPAGAPALVGLGGVMAIRFATTKAALVLPVEAVAGTVDEGRVYVRRDSGVEERSVILGDSDGVNIVIKQGLQEGDVVLLPSPGILRG